MGRDEGISLVLCGATSERFHWHGYGYYLRQIQEILRFSKEYPCHIVVYDRLVLNKRYEIERLAGFLGIEIASEATNELLDSSAIGAMREARTASVGSGKHFRKGTPGDHVNVLAPHHYHMINHLKLAYAPELDVLCEELEFGDITAAPPEASGSTISEVAGKIGSTTGAADRIETCLKSDSTRAKRLSIPSVTGAVDAAEG